MILYHNTKRKNLPNILRQGLIPNKMGIVYLSPVPNAFKNIAFDEINLKVETGDLKLTYFDGCEDWEILCWGHVPPDAITPMMN